MAGLVSGFNPGGSASFSDAMTVAFGKKAVLFNIFNRLGRQGIKFNGSIAKGHDWTCGLNAYTPDADNSRLEGTCDVSVDSSPKPQFHNEVQIFSKETSITGSAAAENGVCSRSADFKQEQMDNRERLALDIDAACAREDAPVASADNSSPRKMAGIKHYVPAANKFDMAGEALNVDTQVTTMMQAIYDAGIVGEKAVLVAGSDVFKDITTFYGNKAQMAPGDTMGGMKITSIITAFGEVDIHAYLGFAPDEFMIFVPKYTALVPVRQFKNKDITTPACDSEMRQDLMEYTLQACPEALTWSVNAGRATVCSDC